MHPRIEELIAYIDAERAKVREAIDRVPTDRRGTSPTPESWSVAQVVEHLAVVERRITAMFRKTIGDARAAGLAAETETSLQLAELNPDRFTDRTKKIVGPPAASPSGTLDTNDALAALDAARKDFRAVVLDADGLALGQVTAPHPAFGPLTLYSWISFVGGHDARHAKQIREIDASLASRSA